ncbi:MAG: hypothetical protein ACPLXM_08485 [Bacteroidales bacterium]
MVKVRVRRCCQVVVVVGSSGKEIRTRADKCCYPWFFFPAIFPNHNSDNSDNHDNSDNNDNHDNSDNNDNHDNTDNSDNHDNNYNNYNKFNLPVWF